jgi:RecA-family ATPase
VSPEERTILNDRQSEAARVNLKRADGIVLRPVEWLWPGYLPLGKLVMVDGDPDLGKSTLLIDLAARVSGAHGGRMPDGSQGPIGNIVLLSSEDGEEDTVKPRLRAAGAMEERVHCLSSVTDGAGERDLELPEDIVLIEETLTRLDARLFLIDPLVAYLSSHVDANRDQDMRRVMRQLKRMAEKCRCTIVCLRHLTKRGSDNPLYRGGGSIGLIGAARAGLLVAIDPEDEQRRVMARIKGNLSVPVPTLVFELIGHPVFKVPMVRWLGQSSVTARELMSPPDDEEAKESFAERELKRIQAEIFLESALKHGPRKTSEIKAEAGRLSLSRSTLKRAVRALKLVLVYNDPACDGEHSWRLPVR